jgi:hypothetical protein
MERGEYDVSRQNPFPGPWMTGLLTGISVSHTPKAVDEATATTALFLLLSAFRQYSHAEINARNGGYGPLPLLRAADKCHAPGVWLKDFPLAHDPEGKVLGIVGMGGIGSVGYPLCKTSAFPSSSPPCSPPPPPSPLPFPLPRSPADLPRRSPAEYSPSE